MAKYESLKSMQDHAIKSYKERMKMQKINITELVMEFNHYICADQVTFTRTKDDGRTLLKQLEDSLNTQLDKILQKDV